MSNPVLQQTNAFLDDLHQGYYIYVFVADYGGLVATDHGDWVRNSSRYYATIRGVRSALQYAAKRGQYGKYRIYGASGFLSRPPYRLAASHPQLNDFVFEQEIKPEILIY